VKKSDLHVVADAPRLAIPNSMSRARALSVIFRRPRPASGSLNNIRGLVMDLRRSSGYHLNPGDPQNYRIIENYGLMLPVSDYVGF
jgi:hypothetical protein